MTSNVEMGTTNKMRLDVEVLEREVKAKHAIMAEVLGGLDEMKSCSSRLFVKSVFNVNPKMSIFPASTAEVSKDVIFGLGDHVVAVFRIKNKSPGYLLSVIVQILVSSCTNVRSKLLNDSSETIDIIGPESTAICMISFENQHLLEENLQLVFCLKWMHPAQGTSGAFSRIYSSFNKQLPHPESIAVVVKEPTDWYNIADFPTFKETEAKRVLEGCSVVMSLRQFKPISVTTFRRLFSDQFLCCDYGELQLFVGTHKFTGLLVTSSLHDYGSVNIAYSSSDIYADRFVKSLIKLSGECSANLAR